MKIHIFAKPNKVTYIIIGLIKVIDLVKIFYPLLPCTFNSVVPVLNIATRSIFVTQKNVHIETTSFFFFFNNEI